MSTGAQHATAVVIALAPIKGSSNIAAAGYHEPGKLLDVQFLSGATHRYAGVPREVYDGFLAAESKGRYFGTEIRGKFGSQRIDQQVEGQQPQNPPEQRAETTLNPQAAWPFPTQSR